QAIPRDVQGDVLEVVFAGPADADRLLKAGVKGLFSAGTVSPDIGHVRMENGRFCGPGSSFDDGGLGSTHGRGGRRDWGRRRVSPSYVHPTAAVHAGSGKIRACAGGVLESGGACGNLRCMQTAETPGTLHTADPIDVARQS